jgi:hypothetical protein
MADLMMKGEESMSDIEQGSLPNGLNSVAAKLLLLVSLTLLPRQRRATAPAGLTTWLNW